MIVITVITIIWNLTQGFLHMASKLGTKPCGTREHDTFGIIKELERKKMECNLSSKLKTKEPMLKIITRLTINLTITINPYLIHCNLLLILNISYRLVYTSEIHLTKWWVHHTWFEKFREQNFSIIYCYSSEYS